MLYFCNLFIYTYLYSKFYEKEKIICLFQKRLFELPVVFEGFRQPQSLETLTKDLMITFKVAIIPRSGNIYKLFAETCSL